MKEIIYANFAAMSYGNYSNVSSGTPVTDLYDDKPGVITTRSRDVFMKYSENGTVVWGPDMLGDWRFTEQLNVTENGFSVTVFENKTDMMVAFRGTNDIADICADAQLLLRGMCTQIGTAYKFMRDVIRYHNIDKKAIHITGHSLGGSLVQAIMATNLSKSISSAVTFNGFGIKESIMNWNSGDITPMALTSCFGWLGIPNIGSLSLSLQKLYQSARKRANSLLGSSISEYDIKNLLTNAMADYANSETEFNTVVEKESKIFDNLLYQFGTVSTSGDTRDRLRNRSRRVLTDEMINSEITSHHIESIKSVMDFFLDVNVSSSAIQNTSNYIISKDIVGCFNTHFGNRYVVDEGDVMDYTNIIMHATGGYLNQSASNLMSHAVQTHTEMYKKFIDKAISTLHSVGNFVLFMDNSGSFCGKIRKSYILNIVRDFIETDPSYIALLGDRNPAMIARRLSDLISGAPVACLGTKSFIQDLLFDWVVQKVLPYLVLHIVDNKFTIGVYTNMDIGNIRGCKSPRIVEINA